MKTASKMNPVVHFELPAADKSRMVDSYTKAFGWRTQMLGPEMGEYVLVTTAPSTAAFTRSWMTYRRPTPPSLSQWTRQGIGQESDGRGREVQELALLLLGLFTRPVAFVLSGEMAVPYFQFHAPQSVWPTLNGGVPAVLYCFIWLHFSAGGAGSWSLDAERGM